MKKLFFSLLLIPSISSAYNLIFNPFTGKLDYVGVDTTTLTGNFIQNTPSSSQSGSIDLSGKANSNNALINLTDTSNPFTSATGYGLKVVINGNLGVPVNAYGIYSSLPSVGPLGDRVAGFFNSSAPASGSNYGGRFSANNGTSGNYAILVDTGQVQFNSSMTVTGPSGFGSSSDTTLGNNPWVVIGSSGTSQNLTININGQPSGGVQNKKGGVTINALGPGGPAIDMLVLYSSYTSSQEGSAMLSLWQDNPNRNDPMIWTHRVNNDSSPEMRFDGPSVNMEVVNTSTDNAHGLGKWEPFAIANQGINLQCGSNRAYDNGTFENLCELVPLNQKDNPPGVYYHSQSLTNDSGVLPSSGTSSINFFTLNSHTVGLTAAPNTTVSWVNAMPDTIGAAGNVMYHGGTVANGTFTDRQWKWATDFNYSATTGVSVSTSTVSAKFTLPSYTKAQLGARSPSAAGAEEVYCSDCTTALTCISTGTAAGAYASQQAANRTTACN